MAPVDLNPPGRDEVEVSLFGPGYGECVVVHLGDGEWLINDSCVVAGSGSQPAALTYLRALGVSAESAVKLIVASHWHDDHIRGLASVVEACPDARFVCSAALMKAEFLRLVSVASEEPSRLKSGLSEFKRIVELIRDRPQQEIEFAIADRVLWRNARSTVVAHALAPSSASVASAFVDFATLIPEVASQRIRVPAATPNGSSVVLWVEFVDDGVLLGGDLENHADGMRGWRAVVQSTTRPPGRASVYKVAHHGSVTANLDEIWTELLTSDSTAIVTPWRRGGLALPSNKDIRRISALSEQTYLTSAGDAARLRRGRLVADEIRRATRSIAPIDVPLGHVRLRRRSGGEWRTELASIGRSFPRQRASMEALVDSGASSAGDIAGA